MRTKVPSGIINYPVLVRWTITELLNDIANNDKFIDRMIDSIKDKKDLEISASDSIQLRVLVREAILTRVGLRRPLNT